MDQTQADQLITKLEAVRNEFYDAAEIEAAYGVTRAAVRKRLSYKQPIVAVKWRGEWLIPIEEAERLWGKRRRDQQHT